MYASTVNFRKAHMTVKDREICASSTSNLVVLANGTIFCPLFAQWKLIKTFLLWLTFWKLWKNFFSASYKGSSINDVIKKSRFWSPPHHFFYRNLFVIIFRPPHPALIDLPMYLLLKWTSDPPPVTVIIFFDRHLFLANFWPPSEWRHLWTVPKNFWN